MESYRVGVASAGAGYRRGGHTNLRGHSVEAAASECRVIVSAPGEVDHTRAERERVRAERLTPEAFDFGPLRLMEYLREQIDCEQQGFDARFAGWSVSG
jgi:hypothetical protein